MDYAQVQDAVEQLRYKLGIDRAQVVDVFTAIRQLGVWLAFKPLPKLHGAFLNPTGETPGVLINSNHPLQLQRYTAAHELGHFWLGHDASIDATVGTSTGDVVFSQLDNQEKQADLFASLFLMPQELLDITAPRVGVDLTAVNSVTPQQVLHLSSNLGTSYASTVNRLRAIGTVNAAYQRYLLEPKPMDLKKEIGGFKPDVLIQEPGRARKPTWHDVVVVDQSSDNGIIYVRSNQVLQVSLTTRLAGYLWELSGLPDSIEKTWTTQTATPPKTYGGGLRHVFTLVGLRAGSFTAVLTEKSAWFPNEVVSTGSFVVRVEQYRVGIDFLQIAA